MRSTAASRAARSPRVRCPVATTSRAQGAKPTATTCGVGGACHTDKVDGGHGATVSHAFTSASDYNNIAVTGCTNSGVGCHNTETTYESFAAYHPASGCLTGACHTSPSKATYTGNHECVSCHDGTFVNAPKTEPLHAPAGVGHYSETNPHRDAASERLSLRAERASATCNDCHNATNLGNSDVRQLYNQHQGLPSPVRGYHLRGLPQQERAGDGGRHLQVADEAVRCMPQLGGASDAGAARD